ncbi:hypothetical protein [Saccharothrix obliqua]|uniref:phosphotriesterase family protein n=1 Tax=Saccharothrix obliqua TaxID=2861747 RepID=UPI001C5EA357|nr:hypothetical protein [Saccharothrix obliqua]MBW4721380.1 hypothetical protein [Saccharothrix obliqua]
MADLRIDGFVLVHEHLSIDYAQKDGGAADWDEALRADAVRVLRDLAALGCAAVVDCTPPGYGRRVDELRAAGEAAGVEVYAATGSFCEQWSPLPGLVAASDVEGLARYFADEVRGPLGGPGQAVVKAATSAGRITDAEHVVLRAAARASLRTGARIVSHTSGGMGLEALDVYEREGVPLERVLVSHVGSHGEPAGYAEEIARRGAFVGLDRIGHHAATDEHWASLITHLGDLGLLGRVLLSHDSVQRFRGPAEIAGHTFGDPTHIPVRFAPLLLDRGLTTAQVRALLVDNPVRWLHRER